MYSTVPSVAMSSDVLIVLLLLSEYSQCLNSVCKFTLCFLLTMHAIRPANSSNIKLQVCGGGKLTNSIGHIYLLNQINCKKKNSMRQVILKWLDTWWIFGDIKITTTFFRYDNNTVVRFFKKPYHAEVQGEMFTCVMIYRLEFVPRYSGGSARGTDECGLASRWQLPKLDGDLAFTVLISLL